MTFPMYSFRDLRHSTLSLILLAVSVAVAGCGSDDSSNVMVSPAGWVVVPSGGQHAKSATLSYMENGGSTSCAECHGADLSGGTSDVSCFDNTSGCHHGPVANWLASSSAAQEHGAAAKRAPGSSGFASCQICHGADFAGGGSLVSCFNCHGVNAPHPAGSWRGGGDTHADTDPLNADVCAQCHIAGSPDNPAGHPAVPAPAGTEPGCFNSTLCHGPHNFGEVNHPVPFLGVAHTSATSAGFAEICGECHSETGSATKTGPACTVCHQAGSPLTAANCASCHDDPPSGATYPNVAGRHGAHRSLPGVSGCTPCHDGLGSGTLEHYTRADWSSGNNALRVPPGEVAILSAYDAKSGAASFDAATRSCSNVSCHGGQKTPDWQAPTADAIDVVNACTSCHVPGRSQHNGYYSGKHDLHISMFGSTAATCKQCHDAEKTNVTGHFQNLATSAFEQSPRATILPSVEYNGFTCSPADGELTGCHKRERWWW